MQTIIDLEVDGKLANYGQILLAMDSLKIERNLLQMIPLKEFVVNQRGHKQNIIVAVASICDYIVYFEESSHEGATMYFMPYYTPEEIKLNVLQSPELVAYFDQLANEIKKDLHCPYLVQFISSAGTVIQIYRNQLN